MIRRSITCLLAGALSLPVFGSKPDEIAVIGTRTETRLAELPNNISVLDSQELETLSADHIQQALSQVPGVNYQRGNGQESLPSIRSAVLTGAGACGSVLVMEEAIPVRGAGFCNVNELFDTHFEQAGRIEVVRGPNTAFYGSNSLTGSINVNLPETGPDQLALVLGPHDYLRASLALGYGNAEEAGATHGRWYLTATDDGGFRDESGYEQQKLSWRHRAELGAWSLRAGLTVTRLDQETAGFVVGPDSYRDPDLREQNLDPEAFRKTDALRAWARLSRQTEYGELTVTPYLRSTDMDFLQHFLPGDPLEENSQTGFGWQSSLTDSFSDQLQWSIGLDAEFSDGELRQTQENPTPGSAFLQETIPVGVHYDYQVDSRQLGAFGHLSWNPSERLRVLAGLRYEDMRYDYDNRALDGRTRDDGTECGFGGCRYSRPADREDSFSNLSPKLELEFRPSDSWRWHLALADSYRAPQATELYRLQRAQTVADLDEVRATTVEGGVHWLGDNGRVDLVAYHTDQRNVIIRDSDFFNVDGQRIESRGIELDAEHQLTGDWSVRLIASLASHEYASDQLIGEINIRGNEVDTAPEVYGSLFVNWRPASRFSGQLEWQHVGDYFLDPENQHEYPGHTIVNLRLAYRLSEQWRLSARVLNVTDRLYAERADFTGFTGERYFPGEPRSVFAELNWRF